MCIGEVFGDTLAPVEQRYMRAIAGRDFPAHDFALCRNEHGIVWAVLSPRATTQALRYTICRLDPGLMVMIEDTQARRQFRAVETIEAAADFLRDLEAEAWPQAEAERVLH